MNRRKYLEIRRIVLIIIFIIILIILGVIGIISFYLILKNADGYYREGLIGLICDAILRVFISLIICTTLFATYFFRERDRASIIWWICLVFSILGIYLLLKAPILDLEYLDNPKSIKLDYVSFEGDYNNEYSVKYHLIGYTKNGEIKIFDINGETYDREKEKWGPYDNVLADIKYLPHTEVLIKLDTEKGES